MVEKIHLRSGLPMILPGNLKTMSARQIKVLAYKAIDTNAVQSTFDLTDARNNPLEITCLLFFKKTSHIDLVHVHCQKCI